MTMGTTYLLIFSLVLGFGAIVNFVIVPAFEDIQTSIESNPGIALGQVGATNSTGNTTSQYDATTIGIFGSPQDQLLTMLIIMGVAGAVAAIAVFGTGAQPGPAAVAAFFVALSLLMINVAIAGFAYLNQIPEYGTMLSVIVGIVLTGLSMYCAAGFMASGSAD